MAAVAAAPLHAADDGDGAEEVLKHLLRLIAELQRVEEAEIDPDEGYEEYGFDSIGLSALARRLGRVYGVDIPVELFFEQTAIRSSAEVIHREYKDEWSPRVLPPTDVDVEEREPAISSAPEAMSPMVSPPIMDAPSRTPEPVAIIGMSGKAPGSEDPDEFWDHLITGRGLITEISPDRLDWITHNNALNREAVRTHMRWGGYLTHIDKFDNYFFSISPREAETMDPQQRLFLETAWRTIENAGYDPADLSGGSTDVFVGVSNHDYANLMKKMKVTPTAHASTGVLVHCILATGSPITSISAAPAKSSTRPAPAQASPCTAPSPPSTGHLEYGLNSLTMIEIGLEVEKRFGVKTTSQTIFNNDNIQKFSRYINNASEKTD